MSYRLPRRHGLRHPHWVSSVDPCTEITSAIRPRHRTPDTQRKQTVQNAFVFSIEFPGFGGVKQKDVRLVVSTLKRKLRFLRHFDDEMNAFEYLGLSALSLHSTATPAADTSS